MPRRSSGLRTGRLAVMWRRPFYGPGQYDYAFRVQQCGVFGADRTIQHRTRVGGVAEQERRVQQASSGEMLATTFEAVTASSRLPLMQALVISSSPPSSPLACTSTWNASARIGDAATASAKPRHAWPVAEASGLTVPMRIRGALPRREARRVRRAFPRSPQARTGRRGACGVGSWVVPPVVWIGSTDLAGCSKGRVKMTA